MNIQSFASALEIAKTDAQARALLHQYLSTHGFKSYAFTYYAGHVKTGRKLHYHCVSEALKPWHIHYLEQGYADVDRTLEENYSMNLPLFWDVHAQLKLAKNKREKRIRQESIEFGIDKGLSIPVHDSAHDFATLTLHQRRGEKCLSRYIDLQYEWLAAAQIFFHHLKKIVVLKKESHQKFGLTLREEQCLKLTAQGFRVAQIAKELKISERTVNFHIQNANRKIGVNNKHQASYQYFKS